MLDTQIFYTLNDLAGQSPLLDSAIVFCASYLAYILAAAFLGLLLFPRAPWREKWALFAVAAISTVLARGIITEGIRYLYHRPRPFSVLPVHQLLTDSAWSFPSGHATFFFALSTAVYFYNRRWGALFFLVSTIIVLARVAGGVHYPSDVLAGAIIGVFSGVFGYSTVRWFFERTAN
jgi:undecaprenyl-diphosphatase